MCYDYSEFTKTDLIIDDKIDDYKIIEYNKDFIGCRFEISLGWGLKESGEWERVIIVSIFYGETDTLYSREVVEADIDIFDQGEIFDCGYDYFIQTLKYLKLEILSEINEDNYDFSEEGYQKNNEFEEEFNRQFDKIEEKSIDNYCNKYNDYYRIIDRVLCEEEIKRMGATFN